MSNTIGAALVVTSVATTVETACCVDTIAIAATVVGIAFVGIDASSTTLIVTSVAATVVTSSGARCEFLPSKFDLDRAEIFFLFFSKT